MLEVVAIILAFVAVACAGTGPFVANLATPTVAFSPIVPALTPMPGPTFAPIALPSPTSPDINPFRLTTIQLGQLGNATEPFVAKRQVVVQRFEHGVMLIFAKSGDTFDQRGGEFIFALVTDGRAWRVRDTFVETSKNPDDWYTCERKPGLRPERSGIPWRGFGKAWCDHPELRDALGLAKIYEDADGNAAFQSYERGRAIRVSDWQGYPGWQNDKAYVIVYGSLANPDFVLGRWE